MNQASFFIEKKALFGGYLSHDQVLELKSEGVVWFIDLTCKDERNVTKYSHLVSNWVNYPIKDRGVPENRKKFAIFLFIIQLIVDSLKTGEKIYLHCRGGHGRSCLVVACFLGLVLNISASESLKLTTEYHILRPGLRTKWLTTSPFNSDQTNFVENYFGSLYLYTHFKLIDSHQDDDSQCPEDDSRHGKYVRLMFYLRKNPAVLETLLNSGMKQIMGEGFTSIMLQDLRMYILYFQAKKIFDSNNFNL